MFSIPLFYQMQQLEISNQNLLDLYYSLYHQLEGEERELQRNQIITRVGCRERMKLELMDCIETNFSNCDQSLLESLGHYCLSRMINFENKLKNFLSEENWSRCYYLEVENLKKYYNVLYNPGLDRGISTLLLNQKKIVEEFLLCPA